MPYQPGVPDWAAGVDPAIVPLVVELHSADGSIGWMAASGFVIEAGERWFWITADHVFNGDRYNSDGLDNLHRYYVSWEAKLRPLRDFEREGILVSFKAEYIVSMPVWAREFAERGGDKERCDFLASLDIALFELSPYYIGNLKACGVVPLTTGDVYREYDDQFRKEMLEEMLAGRFGFYVMGTPRSAYHEDGYGILESIDIKRLPLRLLDHAGPELRFAPLWTDRSHVGSVGGMSGGPVFAIAGDRAYLLAVQSSEFKAGNTVVHLTTAPVSFLFRVIETVAQEVRRWEEAAGNEPGS